MSIYSDRRSFNMTYKSLHNGGKCMVMERGDVEYRIPISQMTIIKGSRECYELKAGDIVSVLMPTWLAQRLGLAEEAPPHEQSAYRYRGKPRYRGRRRKEA